MEFDAFLQKVFQGGIKEYCDIGINNKRELLLFVHMEGIAAADSQECCVMFRDVTESRIVQQSMIFNESKYRALFENISVAFSYHQIFTNSEGQVLDAILLEANSMYAEMLGQQLPDLIGRNKSEVGLSA